MNTYIHTNSACQDPLPALPEGFEEVRNALAAADTLQMQCPLLPGHYNIVPREWLKAWRTYTRDVRLSTPMPPTEIGKCKLQASKPIPFYILLLLCSFSVSLSLSLSLALPCPASSLPLHF